MAISLDCDYPNVILGGGVAGLAAACRLAELGQEALLIEAGTLPSQKVCGEFLSPESLPWLERWGIAPGAIIRRARFTALGRSCEFSLPEPAGSSSRYALDATLADHARQLGAQVVTEMRVTSYRRVQDHFEVILADGQTLVARRILLGTGRLTGKRPALPYVGFKAHFSGVEMGDLLEMHSVADGYLGISSVGEETANVACLLRRGAQLPPMPESIDDGRNLFGWMRVETPTFGRRRPPHELEVYPIGDAAGAIPPACGGGLAMGIASGVLAAEHAASDNWIGYRDSWRNRFSSRLRWGRLLHALMLSPHIAAGVALISRACPFIPRSLFRLTRESIGRYPPAPLALESCPPSLPAADPS